MGEQPFTPEFLCYQMCSQPIIKEWCWLSCGQSAWVQEEGVKGAWQLSPAQGINHLQICLLSMHRTLGSADLQVSVWEKKCTP